MKIILIVLSIFTFMYCNSIKGQWGVSKNIRESKNRKVFVKEYTTTPNPYRINDSIKLKVNEAWLEKNWTHGQNINETNVKENYQLCINTDDEDIIGINFDWTIGLDANLYMVPCGKSSLTGGFKRMPNDTIIYEVQRGGHLCESCCEKIIIGKFMLIAK
jgi:hypothetical protein